MCILCFYSVECQQWSIPALSVVQKLEVVTNFVQTIRMLKRKYAHVLLIMTLHLVLVDPFRHDSTQTGYALGDPAERGIIPSPERSLPPVACAIMRALMHSSLLWASCNNEVKLYN